MTLGGLLLAGVAARAGEPAALPDQLAGLGNQAMAQGRPADAKAFYEKALSIDPKNAAARRGLSDPKLTRIAFRQDPGDTPAPPEPTTPPAEGATEAPAPAPAPAPADVPATPPGATIERAEQLERVMVQRLTAATRERIQAARDLLNAERPEEALTTLRLALAAVQADEQVPEAVKQQLARELQVHVQATVRRE